MHDINKMVQNIDEYKQKLALKKFDLDKEYFLSLANDIKQIRNQTQEFQAKRNAGAKEIGHLIAQKQSKEVVEAKKAEMTELSEQTKVLEAKLSEKEEELKNYMLYMPNIPHDSVPAGNSEEDNVVIGEYGIKPEFNFTPKEHHELGEKMDIIDMERGAKISGSRFSVLKGAGARLDHALKQYYVDKAIEHGFELVTVPNMVNRESAQGTGNLPKFEDEMFKTVSNGKELFLISTAEIPVTNLYANEVFKEEELLKMHAALTPCYRVEVGSAGKDIKGIFRQHQFDKLEMVMFSHPDKSWQAFDKLTEFARNLLLGLGLHFREVNLSSGDLGFSATRCSDMEVWMPGQNKYREISSCSNFVDFQARRANIRFHNTASGKNEFVHTLNGSGMPIGRSIVAVMENYQQQDGSILIPEALKKYLPYEKITAEGKLV